MERQIAHVWRNLLGIEEVGIYDNFFELGGHSLLATQMAAQLRGVLQTALPLRVIFDSPTIVGLSQALVAVPDEAKWKAPAIARLPREEELPLSFGQQQLWFLNQLEPENPYYNLHAAVYLEGLLDRVALGHSLNHIVRRHEVLRTSFGTNLTEPVQVISPDLCLDLPLIDLEGLPPGLQRAEWSRISIAEARRVFNLSRPPLLRAALLHVARREHVLLLTIHHIVWDAWSFAIFLREMAACYESCVQGRSPKLPELPVQYADFASWQRSWLKGDVLEEELDYWRRRLEGAPPLLPLPTDRPRPPIQTFRGARRLLELPRDLADSLKALSLREEITLFMALLAGFKVLLRYYARCDDIVVGTDSAGRYRPEVEGLIGFFVNPLVLRTDLSGNPTFTELLGRIRSVTLEAYEHQDLPFDRLVAALNPERNLSYAPVFQVKLDLLNVPRASLALQGLLIELLEADTNTAQLDLIVNLSETPDGIAGSLEYNTDLFNTSTVERMARQLEELLRAVIERPEIRLSELDAQLASNDLQHIQKAGLEGLRRARRQEVNAAL